MKPYAYWFSLTICWFAPVVAVLLSLLNGNEVLLPVWREGVTLFVFCLLLAAPAAGLIFSTLTPASWGKKAGGTLWLMLFYLPSCAITFDASITPCFDLPEVITFSGAGGNFYILNAGLSPSGSLSCHHSYHYSEIRRQAGFWPVLDKVVYRCNCRFANPKHKGDIVLIPVAEQGHTYWQQPDMQLDLRTGQLSAISPQDSAR